MAMRFGAAFWIQRTGWPELRDAIVRAEAAGFDDLWLDDHLLTDEGDWRDPKLEGWSSLAAIATVTSRARIGLLVAANTFRNPGLTAKLATTLDHVSGGRAILGIGGGWFEREHDAFGIDFGAGFGERLDRLGEAVPLIRRLLDGERVTHEGRFYRMHDAVCEPRPIQARLPILIGGSGPRKTLPLVARYADIWNAYGSPDTLAAADAILREACAAAGRDEQRDRADDEPQRRHPRQPWRGGRRLADVARPASTCGPGATTSTPAARRMTSRRARAVSGGRVRARDLRVPQPVRPRDHRPPAGAPGATGG